LINSSNENKSVVNKFNIGQNAHIGILADIEYKKQKSFVKITGFKKSQSVNSRQIGF